MATGLILTGINKGFAGCFDNWATNLRRDTEQQNDSPSTKKSVIPAGRVKRGLAGIQLPWMAITKHTIDL